MGSNILYNLVSQRKWSELKDAIWYATSADANFYSLKTGRTPLHEGCYNGAPLDVMKLLIDKGANITLTDSEGQTPLLILARNPYRIDWAVFELLLKKGADVNALVKDNIGIPPLVMAIQYNAPLSAIELLIEKGVNPNSTKPSWPTPLMAAFYQKPPRWEAIKLLVNKGANVKVTGRVGKSPLFYACKFDAPLEILATLLEHGADPNALDNYDTSWHHKETLLHWAIRKKRVDVDLVKLLLEKGANVNGVIEVPDVSFGMTPLLYAFEHYASWEVVQVLLKNGADASNKSVSLHYVAIDRKAPLEVVRLLIKQGADVKAQFGGQTLFYSAITKSAWDLAQVLIENTPDVNSLGQYTATQFKTALHVACEFKSPLNIIQLLIDKGASVHARCEQERTPLHYACTSPVSFDTVKLLIAEGSDVNALDNVRRSPLHFACSTQAQSEVIGFLLAKGSNALIRDIHGLAAIDLEIRADVKDLIRNQPRPEFFEDLFKLAGIEEVMQQNLYGGLLLMEKLDAPLKIARLVTPYYLKTLGIPMGHAVALMEAAKTMSEPSKPEPEPEPETPEPIPEFLNYIFDKAVNGDKMDKALYSKLLLQEAIDSSSSLSKLTVRDLKDLGIPMGHAVEIIEVARSMFRGKGSNKTSGARNHAEPRKPIMLRKNLSETSEAENSVSETNPSQTAVPSAENLVPSKFHASMYLSTALLCLSAACLAFAAPFFFKRF